MFNNPESDPAWKFFQHNTFFFNVDSPKLEDAVIRFSNHGWLLMTSHDNGTLFFYHPFNNHIIQLHTPNYAFKTMCFFHPPTSPECFVVGIATEMVFPYDMMRIGVLKHGESDWKKSINHNKYHPFMLSAAPPIFCNGILLFLDVKRNVGVFNINKHWTPLDWGVFMKCLKQRRHRRNIKEHYLIKPEGEREFFVVLAMHDDIKKVSVFRLSRGFSWELVEDIGDRVFYVSNTSSFGYRTNVKTMANKISNKIFFTKFHGDKVVYYSMDTQKFHSFEGAYSSKTIHGLESLDVATWVVPTITEPQLSEESLAWCPPVDQAST